MLLAAPGQLLSVSRVSADPKSAPMAAQAADFPLNSGQAEQIAALRPDLVLAGALSDRLALDMLRRIGIPVVQLPLTHALAEIPDQIRDAGCHMQRSDAAETLARDDERRLAACVCGPPGCGVLFRQWLFAGQRNAGGRYPDPRGV